MNTVDVAQQRVSLQLKKSAVLCRDTRVQLSDLAVGTVISGRLKNVTAFGVFIEVSHSLVSGLCHKSEVY